MSMRVMPKALQEAVEACQAATRSHPEHQLIAVQRRSIYRAFGQPRSATNYRARSWLGIITARHVLPIGAQALPEEAKVARQIIDLAEAIVTGAVAATSPEVEHYGSLGYFGWITPLLEDLERRGLGETFTLNVNCAFRAAYFAFLEACGVRGLEDLRHYVNRRRDGPVKERLQKMSDLDIAFLGASDAAAPAAVAEGWDSQANAWRPAALEAFWNWWLTRAVPAAWEAALTQRGFLAGNAIAPPG